MRTQILSVLGFCLAVSCYGQTDTIYSNNQKIPCIVREVTEDAVKYSYPGEDLTNTVYKNTVQKICFKSGRVQTFAEGTSYKKVNGVEDYDNVTITAVESETKGLYKVGDVSSKAKGTTSFSNQERVKERAYKKMKIEAAMMGANIVYLTDQRGQGNIIGTKYSAGQTTETSLSGVAYTNILPNIEDFKKLIGNNKNFVATEQNKLWSGAADMQTDPMQAKFSITNIINDNGIITLEAFLDGESDNTKFRVVSFSANSFNIYYRDKSTSYFIRIKA